MSDRTATGPVQRAVYACLANDATLAALAPVYEDVPQGTVPPYIELAEIMEDSDDTFGGVGRQITVTIFAFTTVAGFKPLEDILDRLLYLLDEGQPTIQAADSSQWLISDSVYGRNPGSETTKMPDGLTRQLAARFVISAQRL